MLFLAPEQASNPFALAATGLAGTTMTNI